MRRGRIKVTDILHEEKCKSFLAKTRKILTAQSKYGYIWTKWKRPLVSNRTFVVWNQNLRSSLLGQDNRFYRVGWLWLAGGLLLCTIRGRLLDCKPTFYLQSDGGSGCKRVVWSNNTPIKVAAASE